MRAHRSLPATAAIVGALAATIAHAPAVRAAPVEIRITTTAMPAPVATIPFDDLVKSSATLDVVDAPGKDVELYLLSSSAEQRARTACRLPVLPGRRVELHPASAAAADAAAGNTSCRNLLPGKDPLRLAVSAVGSSAFGVVSFEPPAPYSGGPAGVVVQRGPGPAGAIVWPLRIPANVKLVGTTCWLFARSWVAAPCARNEIAPDERARAAFEAAVMSGGAGVTPPVAIVAQVIDASSGTAGVWRALSVEVKEPPAPPVPAPPELDLNKSCEAVVTAEVKKGIAPKGAFYAICADLRKPETPFVTTWIQRDKGPFERADDHRMNVNHPVVVYVWHASPSNPGIDLVGMEGFPSSTYVPPGGPFIKVGEHSGPLEEPIPGVQTAHARKQFGARKGPTAVLTLTVRSGNDPVIITRTYAIENAYRTALRVGIGVAWSPWAKEIGIRTAGDNRRYAAVTDGDGALPGLVSMELVVGYSIFATPVRESHADDTVAFNLGLGVLRAGGTVEALSSLRLGIEWAHGLDFSLGLGFGLHRHDVPKEDFRPGVAIPQSAVTIEKTFGVTPGFGLVLNLTPSFLKAAGLVAGGGTGGSI